MNNHELDISYTALAQALTRVGAEQAPLFLSMLCLSLISRQADYNLVLKLIEQAEAEYKA
jgi:hypothetical protein